jgi:hypothetical protein
MARDVRVSFKLSDAKKAELEQFAIDYGVTMSALCALIVGQWLYQQNKVIAPIAQGMSDFLKNQFAQLVAQAKEQDRP